MLNFEDKGGKEGWKTSRLLENTDKVSKCTFTKYHKIKTQATTLKLKHITRTIKSSTTSIRNECVNPRANARRKIPIGFSTKG